MIQFKTKMKNGEIIVKSKYNYSDFNELQLDMIAIMTEFGTYLSGKGVKKEKVDRVLDNTILLAKEHINYGEGE